MRGELFGMAKTACGGRMIMNNDDKFRSAFRTVELIMIAMLASGATNNFVFWITFALALIFDVCIDVSAR